MSGPHGHRGAFMMPSTLSVLAQVFRDPGERGQAIGIWSAVAGGAVAAGPVLGGLLLDHFDWHAIFLINPALAVVAIVVTIAIVPESHDPKRPKLDPLGAVLSTTGLIAVVFAIIEIPGAGIGVETVGAGLGGIALLVGFMAWELHTPAPILDMRFFTRPLFSVSVLSVAVIYFALFGAMFFVPQFLQLVRGLSPLASGIGVMPLAGSLLVASLLSPRWATHVGARTVVVAGLIAVGTGMLLAGFLTASTPYILLGIVLGLMGTGLGLALPQATNGILASVPREKAGRAPRSTTRSASSASPCSAPSCRPRTEAPLTAPSPRPARRRRRSRAPLSTRFANHSRRRRSPPDASMVRPATQSAPPPVLHSRMG